MLSFGQQKPATLCCARFDTDPSVGHRPPGYARLSLRVTADEAVERSWRVTAAELRENPGSTWGVLLSAAVNQRVGEVRNF